MEYPDQLETANSSNEDVNESFIQSVDSRLNIKSDYEKKDIDLTWVERFEDTVRYIDNILRNPKRFIINEEEIVKIEQAKKITVESVIHLTQHTNFIQDIDDRTGDVRPSKILNINKEESLDTYENRFIYTLVKQMNMFFEQRINTTSQPSYCYDKKKIQYDATAKMDDEDVKISVFLQTSNYQKENADLENGLSIEERLKKLKVQLSGLMEAELIKTLGKLRVPMVRPPIRKTNVILKNPNFQKATELWNYLNRYVDHDSFIKDNQDYMEDGPIKNQFDETFLLNYLALNSISKNPSNQSTKKFVNLTVKKLIETVLENHENMRKREFDRLISREYQMVRDTIRTRDRMITELFQVKFDKENKKISDACTLLR